MEENEREKIEKDLRDRLNDAGIASAVFEDILGDYLAMCDEMEDVRAVAARAKDDPKQGGLYMRCMARISNIEKDKISTLKFLGIRPGPVEDKDYEL